MPGYSKYVAYAMLIPAVIAVAAEKPVETETKAGIGMSIVGNNETPKSLYIVPWKTSEVGGGIRFSTSALNEGLNQIDKDEFIRQLDLYRSGNPK